MLCCCVTLFFYLVLCQLNTVVGLQLNEVDSERVAWFAGSLGADFALTPYKQWSHVNLVRGLLLCAWLYMCCVPRCVSMRVYTFICIIP